MWLVSNNSGRVTIQDDGGNEEYSGPVSIALLGLARALHRMREAETELDRMLTVCETRSEKPEWLLDHIASLKAAKVMMSLGAAPSHSYNAEKST